MTPFFQTDSFSSAMMQALDYAAYGGADITECLEAAKQIRDGDCESWHRAWIALADRVRRNAAQALSRGRKIEVRNAFLRAAHYYRTAGQFLNRNPQDARIATTAGASAACFATAMRLSGPTCEIKEIEHEHTRRTAYLHRVDDDRPVHQTMLVVGEPGASPLELYFSCAVPALRCGWNCLTFTSHTETESALGAESLLTAAIGIPSVDPGCLALAVFRVQPVSLSDMSIRRLLCHLAIGNANEVRTLLKHKTSKAAFVGDTTTNHPFFATLGGFHQDLLHWLDGTNGSDERE